MGSQQAPQDREGQPGRADDEKSVKVPIESLTSLKFRDVTAQ